MPTVADGVPARGIICLIRLDAPSATDPANIAEL